MLKTVKKSIYNIGDETADLAKRVSSGTADIAKRVGSGTAGLAKDIGMKRALVGLAVIGVIVGGSVFLVRYLRARKEELPFEGADDQARGRASSRQARRGAEAQFSH
jgi:hypothetical protein